MSGLFVGTYKNGGPPCCGNTKRGTEDKNKGSCNKEAHLQEKEGAVSGKGGGISFDREG